jgi:spermidine synthase
VLGTGLGSIVNVLDSKGAYPRFTLVEIDKLVLNWAMEVLSAGKSEIVPVCSDALIFMERNQAEYDLVFIDIFNGRIVPEFATDIPFLTQCRSALAPGGRLVLNYIINDQRKWDIVSKQFAEVFPVHQVLNNGINRILITDAHEKSRN